MGSLFGCFVKPEKSGRSYSVLWPGCWHWSCCPPQPPCAAGQAPFQRPGSVHRRAPATDRWSGYRHFPPIRINSRSFARPEYEPFQQPLDADRWPEPLQGMPRCRPVLRLFHQLITAVASAIFTRSRGYATGIGSIGRGNLSANDF